jgi:hypothetical protein
MLMWVLSGQIRNMKTNRPVPGVPAGYHSLVLDHDIAKWCHLVPKFVNENRSSISTILLARAKESNNTTLMTLYAKKEEDLVLFKLSI